MFSAIVSALRLAAFPCLPQVDEIFCVRAAALIFCVDHRASDYLRGVKLGLKFFHFCSHN